MTISKDGVRIITTCDGCGHVRRDQEGQRAVWRPYPAAWKEAQAAGWTAKEKQRVRDFDHFCPTCSTHLAPQPAHG